MKKMSIVSLGVVIIFTGCATKQPQYQIDKAANRMEIESIRNINIEKVSSICEDIKFSIKSSEVLIS